MSSVLYREASATDAEAVATLHAASWRRHYRGAYADSFLDGDVVSDRRAVWAGRLAARSDDTRTQLAVLDGRLVGFVHTILDADPGWGALIDNLHVEATYQRHGIGRELLARGAGFVAESDRPTGLYLWVLERNVAAQRFYTAAGGQSVESAPVSPVGGQPGRLAGEPLALRYVWRDAKVLAGWRADGIPGSG